MMRDAARALDDVSDHLGEVLRRADDLLVEWSKLGGQVRAQVEREAAAVGEVVEGAVGRAASAGLDRAIGDRLRALTVEIERLEQRTRAASRAVVEQREGDRRILWAVVAGIALANALLVALLLRRPEAAPVAEPIRLDAPAVTQPADMVPGAAPAASSGSGVPPAGSVTPSAAPSAGAAPADAITGGAHLGTAQAKAPAAGSGAAPKPPAAGSGAGSAVHPAEPAAAKTSSPIVLPARPGPARPHKKLP